MELSLLLDSRMKLRSERTAALSDERKQPSTNLAAFVCMCTRSKLSQVKQF